MYMSMSANVYTHFSIYILYTQLYSQYSYHMLSPHIFF